jgi:hypothetical protein
VEMPITALPSPLSGNAVDVASGIAGRVVSTANSHHELQALTSAPSSARTRQRPVEPSAKAPEGIMCATTVGTLPATVAEVYSPSGVVPVRVYHWKCAMTALSASLTVARSVGVFVPRTSRPEPVTQVADPSVVRFVGGLGTVLYSIVTVGLFANFFHDRVSCPDSAVLDARRPIVTSLHPYLAALVTCVVTANSTPPAGQSEE